MSKQVAFVSFEEECEEKAVFACFSGNYTYSSVIIKDTMEIRNLLISWFSHLLTCE